MSPPVRIAVLGNSFAARAQLPALRWVGGCEVVGIAGRNGAKARRTAEHWGIALATDDWRELLDLEPDLVIVATPVDLHRAMVCETLAGTGAAVLCEKPFALDAAEAKEMLRAAGGRAAWIDHQLRWSPHQRRIRAMLAAGELGEVRRVSVEMLLSPRPGPPRPWSWWFDADRGGGILGAIGSHLIDLVRWHLGEPAQVRCDLGITLPERPDGDGVPRRVTADDWAQVDLSFEQGARVSLVTSISVPSECAFRFQVTGTAGVVRMQDGDLLAAGPLGGPLEPVAVEPGLPSPAELGMPDLGLFSRCLPLYLRDVLEAVRSREPAIPGAAGFADGLAVQRVLDAARRSAAAGGGWTDVASGG